MKHFGSQVGFHDAVGGLVEEYSLLIADSPWERAIGIVSTDDDHSAVMVEEPWCPACVIKYADTSPSIPLDEPDEFEIEEAAGEVLAQQFKQSLDVPKHAVRP